VIEFPPASNCIRIGGSGVINRANSSMNAREILGFIIASSPRLMVWLSLRQFPSFYAAIGASQSFPCVSAKVD
jgi:hypothetical protein